MGSGASKPTEAISPIIQGAPKLVARDWRRQKDGSLSCKLTETDISTCQLVVSAEVLSDLGWTGQEEVTKAVSKASGEEWPDQVDVGVWQAAGTYIFRLQGGFSQALGDYAPAAGDELRLWFKHTASPSHAVLTIGVWRSGAPLPGKQATGAAGANSKKQPAEANGREKHALEPQDSAALVSDLVSKALEQAVTAADGVSNAPAAADEGITMVAVQQANGPDTPEQLPGLGAVGLLEAAADSPGQPKAALAVGGVMEAAAEGTSLIQAGAEVSGAAEQAELDGANVPKEDGVVAALGHAVEHAVEHAMVQLEHAIVTTIKDRHQHPFGEEEDADPSQPLEWSEGASRFDRLRDLQRLAHTAGVPADLTTELNIALLKASEVQLGTIYRAARRGARAGGARRALRLLRALLPPPEQAQASAGAADPWGQLEAVQLAMEAAAVEPAQLNELEAAWLVEMSPAQRSAIHTATLRAAGVGTEGMQALGAAAVAALQQQQEQGREHQQASDPQQGTEEAASNDSYAMLEAMQRALGEAGTARLEPGLVLELEVACLGMGLVQQQAIHTAVLRAASAAPEKLPRLVTAVVAALPAPLGPAPTAEEAASSSPDSASSSSEEDACLQLRTLQLLFSQAAGGPAAAAEVAEFEAAWFGATAPQRSCIFRALRRAGELAQAAEQGENEISAGNTASSYQGVGQLAATAVGSLEKCKAASQGDPHEQLCQLQALLDSAQPGSLPQPLLARFELVWLGLESDSQWQFCKVMLEDAHKAGGLRDALDAIVASSW
ncbi:hypothetical protein N2152v2_002122 [Parachlorella kessleri]